MHISENFENPKYLYIFKKFHSLQVFSGILTRTPNCCFHQCFRGKTTNKLSDLNDLNDPFFFFPLERHLGGGDFLLFLTHCHRRGSRYGGHNTINSPEHLLYLFSAMCFSGVQHSFIQLLVFSQRKLGLYVFASMEERRLRDSYSSIMLMLLWSNAHH